MTISRPGNFFIIILLGALTTVSPFSIDMYLPAFAQIAADFGTTPSRVSLSLASYFIGFALGQILFGPLLDRYGRKKPLFAGLTLYILTCIGCVTAHDITSLIVYRFVQALGGCAALVAAMAMVRDFFPARDTAKIISLLMLVLGVSPLLAPTVGGYVTTWWGWHGVFIVLAITVAIILGVTCFFLPEGHKPDPTVSLRPGTILSTYMSIMKHPQFFTYSLSGAFSFASLFVYVAGSPIVFMEHFKVGAQTYGMIFALLSVGFIGGNQLNIFLAKKFQNERIFRFALVWQIVIGFVFLLGTARGWYGLNATVGMFFASLCCLGLTYPNASALALAPFTRNVGSAAALIGFLQIGVAALAACGVGIANSSSNVPIIALLASAPVVAWFILIIGTRAIKNAEAPVAAA